MIPTLHLGGLGLTRRAGSGVLAVTFDPGNKHSSISLSGGNLTATKTGGGDAWASARASAAKSTGKWYWEMLVALGGGTGPDMICGIGNGVMGLTQFVGQDVGDYGYYARDGKKVTAGAFVAFGATYGVTAVINFAWDVDAGKLWMGKNGAYQASGDPAAGTNQAFSGVAAGLFPCVSIYNGGSIQAFTGRFRASDQSYAPPSGFSVYDPT